MLQDIKLLSLMARRALGNTHEQIQHEKIEIKERGLCTTIHVAGYLRRIQDSLINRSEKLKQEVGGDLSVCVLNLLLQMNLVSHKAM